MIASPRSLPAPLLLRWLLALAATLTLPSALGHDGHEHEPVGRWFFWPDYALDGRARNSIGSTLLLPRTPFERVDVESAPLLLLGEKPTDRASRLLPAGLLPDGAFSVELWLVDHVNQPVGALVGVRSRSNTTDPGWMLGYQSGRAFFSVRAGAEPGPVLVESDARSGYKRYWRHLVATHDRNTARLYLNGRLVAESGAAGTLALPPDPELEIAAYLAREPHMQLANLVREVRLYNDDIGPTQVAQRFQQLSHLVDEGLIHPDRFHFNAGPALVRMTQTNATLVWETDRPARAIVRFGTNAPGDQVVRIDSPQRLQNITLPQLSPETPYFYEITALSDDGGDIRSGPLTFKTAVLPDSAFAFAVLGDTEARPHINDRLAKAIWGERPDFTLNVGDLTDGGQAAHKFQWNLEYFLGMNQLAGRIPIFPVPGNGESDLHWYLPYHALPAENGHRYAFRYGNAEFFMLDSNRPLGPGSEQFVWLDQALAASSARWKFVCHHHPVYTSDTDDYGDAYAGASKLGDPNPRSAVPLYEKHGVDIVFYGHIHAYERTWPMMEGRVDQQRGVRYVQTGGGGGNLEEFTPTRNAFSHKLYRGHHYCLLRIHLGDLTFQMFDVDGQLRDTFEIHKP